MDTQARVVVIGGGIAGCSVLYHLTQEGWTDVVLLERDELTSGSTWHAAAQVTQFGGNQTMVALKRHSIDLYKRLAADTDHPISYHITGGMRLAHTRDQVDTYKHYVDMAAGVGVEMEFIDAAEVHKRHPLINPEGLLGAWWDPNDGDIDPAGITFSLAREARKAGAVVKRFTAATSIDRKPSGEFVVTTAEGTITCEMVVNAGGYRVNEIGSMLGVTHPVTSMEHMYFLTESMPELEALDYRVPIIRDPGDDFYSRQEKKGLLVGVYEQQCKTFGIDGIDPDFTKALCPSDLDRCLDNMERIFERMPAVAEAGIHTVINGPITYTPDGAPLIGPVPGVPNYFSAIGLRAGIGESGGHGKILAELMVHGECEWDAWFLDPRRFTSYATTEYTKLRAIEDYQNEFHYHMPHEYRPAARMARTTPLYSTLDGLDAKWGVVNGWERVLYFKPEPGFTDHCGYRFSERQDVVAQEVSQLVDGVGIAEVSGFNRYEISGEGATEFLDKMVCSNLPKAVGRVRLCYLLTEKGNVLSEATIIKLGEDHFWYGSAAASEWHDRDWLNQHKPDTVLVREGMSDQTILLLVGPDSRKLLQSVTPLDDVSASSLPWLQARQITVAHAPVLAMAVSFSGESSIELHVPNEHLQLVWNTLWQQGLSMNLSLFGLDAIESMRLEKGYRHWKADLIYEFNPFESGLSRFVNMDKADFIGKQALQGQLDKGLKRSFAVMTIDCDIAAAHSGSPVFKDGVQTGTVTSGGYGFRTGLNIAYAMINPEDAETGTKLEVGIIGERYPATVVDECIYDPNNERIKA